jgi:signal peptidase
MDEDRLERQTGVSKLRKLALAAAAAGIYLIENYSPDFIRNAPFFIYIINSILWILIIYAVFCLPRPRPRGNTRSRSFLIWMSFLCSFIYILIMMICGLAVGFGKSPFNHTLSGIAINLLKIFSELIALELIRNCLINNTDRNVRLGYFAFVTIFIAAIKLDFDQIRNLETNLDKVRFIGSELLPELCGSIFASYLVYMGGPVLSIIYLGMKDGFYWLSPVLPNINWLMQAFIGILLPIFCMMFFNFCYSKVINESKPQARKVENPVGWVIVTTFSILIIWFAIGVFPVRPYVIMSGSMEPQIKAGDLVLVKRDVAENMKVGDVIQYKSGDFYVFHRIIGIEEEDKEIKYKTRGDNNSFDDPELVKPENIRGIVIYTVPKIGYPALIIRSLI